MSAAAIILDAVRSIPKRARLAIYLVWALAVATEAVLTILEVPTGAATEVLLYVGGLLGVGAAANVPASED